MGGLQAITAGGSFDGLVRSMTWLILRSTIKGWASIDLVRLMLEFGLSLSVGLAAGALVVISLGYGRTWQSLILLIPIVLALVLVINDLEKVILGAIAISVPMHLDVSLVVSRYARNPENIAHGYRTLVALTELRLSLVFVLIVVGYAAWFIGFQGPDRKPVRFFAGTTIPALGLVFFSILSVFQAQDRQLSLFRVAQLFELFLVYFYVANHLQKMDDMRFFVTVLMVALLVESILMILQWQAGLEFSVASIATSKSQSGRVAGTLGTTGAAAGFLSAQALIAFVMLWAFSVRRDRRLAALAFGLGIIALVGTGSRIGWAALAITLPLCILIGLRLGQLQQRTVTILIAAVLVLGFVFYTPIRDRLTRDDLGSAEARFMMYRLAWNMIQENMWLGVGAGNYALETPEYYDPDVGNLEQVIDIQVHNRYLGIWAESGLFAVICYVAFLGIAAVKALSCAKSNDRWISVLGIGLGCAIISLCIQMLTDTFHIRAITLFTWLLVAMAASLYHIEQAHRESV